MKVAVKYLILIFGLIAGFFSMKSSAIGAGICCAGALIAYAIIETQDLRIMNDE